MQDFSNDCDTLIPQGNVLSRRDYVRVTLLEITIDDAVNQLGEKALAHQLEVPGLFRLGLPWSLIDPEFGTQFTGASKVYLDKKELLVGFDSSFLYGYSQLPYPKVDSKWISEADLCSDTVTVGPEKKALNAEEMEKLRSAGIVKLLLDDQTKLHVRIKKSPKLAGGVRGIRPSLADSITPNLAYSMTPTSVFTPDEQGFEVFLNKLRGLGNTISAIIEGFLADNRAGPWFDPKLKAWTTWIPGLTDAAFGFYMSKLKAYPQWPQIAPAAVLRSYPIALVNVFSQTQSLQGYTRGRLVESVTLGPEESVEVEVFSWDRTITERSEELGHDFERTSEREGNTTTNAQVTTAMEHDVGANVGGNLGVGLPIEAAKVDADVQGGVSSELQTRNETTVDLLSEATNKASERFKATHQVKTLTRRETGTERRTTRTIKNPNLGRALDVHHFEVLGHYEVITKVDERLRLAVLVENDSFGLMDRDWVRAHHHFLDEVLPHDVFREGLEAAQILAAQEWLDELAAAEKRTVEEERQRLAEKEISSEEGVSALPRKGVYDKAIRMRDIFEKMLEYNVNDAIDVVIRFHNILDVPSRQEVEEADQVISQVAWWTQFTLAYPAMKELAETYVIDIAQAEESTSSDPEEKKALVISAVGSIVNALDDDWLMSLKAFAAGYVLAELALPLALNPIVYAYVMKLLYMPNDMGLQKLISKIRADYVQHDAKQSVETLTPPAADHASITPADRIPPPTRAYTKKELAEAHASFGRLKAHLEAHDVQYRNEYYKREDPASRLHRLRLMGVAPFVENTLLGFAGNAGIYPLKLSALPKQSRDALQDLGATVEESSNSYEAKTTIALPTGGITSELVLGQCDALEPYLQERRALDLEKRRLENELLNARIAATTNQPASDQTPVPDEGG